MIIEHKQLRALRTHRTGHGCVGGEAELIDEILAQPNRFRVQVHTQAHPQGALAAQLKRGRKRN